MTKNLNICTIPIIPIRRDGQQERLDSSALIASGLINSSNSGGGSVDLSSYAKSVWVSNNFAPLIHIHDDRYYTECQLNAGQLDDRYFTETELLNGSIDCRYYTHTCSDSRYVNVSGDFMQGKLYLFNDLSVSGVISGITACINTANISTGNISTGNISTGNITNLNSNCGKIISYSGECSGINHLVSNDIKSNNYTALNGYNLTDQCLVLNNIRSRFCGSFSVLTGVTATITNINTSHIQSVDYNGSTFADTGMYLSNSMLAVDDAVIRRSMRIFALEIAKVRVSNGSLMVTDGATASSNLLHDSNGHYFSLDTDCPFEVNDFILSQSFESTNLYCLVYMVTGITSNKVYIHDLSQTPLTGITSYVFARTGNLTDYNRQGFVMINSSGADSPSIAVYDQVKTSSFSGNTKKAIIGKLPSILLPDGSYTNGYGFYTENGYLVGLLFANAGTLGGLIISPNGLTAKNVLNSTCVQLNSQTGSIIGINSAGSNILEITGNDASSIASLISSLNINFPLVATGYTSSSYLIGTAAGTYQRNYYLQSNSTTTGNTNMRFVTGYTASYDWYFGTPVGIQINIDGQFKVITNNSSYSLGTVTYNIYYKSAGRSELIKTVNVKYLTSTPQYINFNYVLNNLTDSYGYIYIEEIFISTGLAANITLTATVQKLHIYANAVKTEIANQGITIANASSSFRVNTNDATFLSVNGSKVFCGTNCFTDYVTVGNVANVCYSRINIIANDCCDAGLSAFGNSSGAGLVYVGANSTCGAGMCFKTATVNFYGRCNSTYTPAFSFGQANPTVSFCSCINVACNAIVTGNVKAASVCACDSICTTGGLYTCQGTIAGTAACTIYVMSCNSEQILLTLSGVDTQYTGCFGGGAWIASRNWDSYGCQWCNVVAPAFTFPVGYTKAATVAFAGTCLRVTNGTAGTGCNTVYWNILKLR